MSRIATAFLATAVCLGIRAQAEYGGRIKAVQGIMDRYYRGERLEEAIDRSNAQIRSYNARARAKQAETEKERSRLEALLAPIEEARGRLKAMDGELKQQSSAANQEAIKRQIDARNALVKQINELSAKARVVTDTYNALARDTQQELDRERSSAMEAEALVNARLEAFGAFVKAGQDAAFFRELTQLLADVRQALRQDPGDASLQGFLQQVRSLRRELATWAVVGQSLKANGLVIVEVLLEDEPCWFIVDTGAMDTIVSEEIMVAVGQGARLRQESTLSVVGGAKVVGLACRISRLTVAGQTRTDVAASAVRPSDVGVDGLLGQSFLKGFHITIDERKPAKLLLTPQG